MKYIAPKQITTKIGIRLAGALHPFLKVPGMMGYQERMNLYKTCKNELKGNGSVVEFGAFLGASTSAIQNGLKYNKNFSRKPEFHVYDCFRCPIESTFSALVRNFSAIDGVESLLKEEDGWLCFYDAFLVHVCNKEFSPIIHKCFVSDLDWRSNDVEFLHLDLPKDWEQANFIASSVFPDLILGAKVLFQDFGYQWSAELIAMVDYFVRRNFFSPYRLTDTTLSVNVQRKISLKVIIELRELMRAPSFILNGIENSRVWCRNLNSNSIDQILLMAKAQYQYALGDSEGAFSTLSMMLLHNKFDEESRMRLIDLFNCEFRMEKSYEQGSTQNILNVQEV